MRFSKIILTLATLFIASSCINRVDFWHTESAVARVDEMSLYPSQIVSVLPEGLSSSDSITFVTTYIERWTQREAKLIEAQRVFASSNSEIEKRVEEYRRKLLLDKLDRYILEKSEAINISTEQIEEYYNHYRSQFRVEKPLVQYCMVQYNSLFSSPKDLKKLLDSQKASDREDLRSICEKNRLILIEGDNEWVEFSELLSTLPHLEPSDEASLLKSNNLHLFSEDGKEYLVKITNYRNVGDTTPLPLLEESIRGILLKREHNRVLKEYEDDIYRKALNRGEISFPSTNNIN